MPFEKFIREFSNIKDEALFWADMLRSQEGPFLARDDNFFGFTREEAVSILEAFASGEGHPEFGEDTAQVAADIIDSVYSANWVYVSADGEEYPVAFYISDQGYDLFALSEDENIPGPDWTPDYQN